MPQNDTSPTARAHASLERALQKLRTRARALLAGRELLLLAAGAVGFVLLFSVIDFGIRLPAAIRWINLLGALALAMVFLVRRVRPAMGFAPRLVDLAIRLERSGLVPGAAGELATSFEFGKRKAHGSQSAVGSALQSAVTERTAQRFAAVRATQLANPTKLARAAMILASLFAVSAAAGVARPELAGIGLARTLAPWTDASWPKRTIVRDDSQVEVHPIGSALPLRATLLKTNRAEGRTRVTAVVRVLGYGQEQERRIPMTAQPTIGDAEGERFERLVDPGVTARSGDVTLEYYFETEDDRTQTARVVLTPRPSVESVVAQVTPPEYARRVGAGEAFVSGERRMLEMDRPLLSPVLAESLTELTITLSKPVPAPQDESAFAATFGPAWEQLGQIATFAAADDGTGWTLSWPMREAATLRISPVDQYGIESLDATVLAFDAAPDLEPNVTIVAPARDEAVLPTAVITVETEARDDVGLASAWLTRQTARPPADSPGGLPEPEGEPETIETLTSDGSALRLTSSTELDLGPLELNPGDELTLTAYAQDIYETAGAQREPIASTPRVLRIIEPTQLVEQLRAELVGVRRAVVTLDEDQAELASRTRSGVVGPEMERRQGNLSKQLDAQRRLIERLQDRISRNNLEDPQLTDTLSQAERSLEQASEASQRASQEIGRAGTEESQPERQRAQEQASAEQSRVRDELGRLAELLDRGEDGWLARRGVERLLEEQRRLSQQTERLARETVGKSADELTPEQAEELQRIAEQQQELADRAEQAIEDLADRSREIRDNDEAQSSALAQAAERARSEQLEEQLRQAGQSAQQNRAASANQQQRQAEQTIEQMLEDLDRAEQSRDERLRRQLASIIDSVKGLIEEQNTQIAALEANLPNLDEGMIRLHTNTVGVTDEARAGAADLRVVAGLLGQAADKQTDAIIALRADTPDLATAGVAEADSLALLEQALREAEKLDQQAGDREQERVRAELEKAYAAALAEQTELRDATEPLVGERLNRRQRQDIRGYSERQMDLRATLSELLQQTEGLSDAGVFAFAHRRLDRVMLSAGEDLAGGSAEARTLRNQNTAVRLLAEMVEAMKNEQPDKDFRENQQEQQQAGEGESGMQTDQPLVPPLSQLKMLRAMQIEALERTRGASDLAGEDRALEREEIGTLQRELADTGSVLLQELTGESGIPQPAPEAPAQDEQENQAEENR